ncbi:MAG: hypothetical protein ACJ0UT_01780 [Candidatus Latescibacterota bacterium]
MTTEKRNARGHEIFLLVFRAEETLVDFGKEALESHDQKKNLHQTQLLKFIAEKGREIQWQKDRDVKVDTARKGLRLEALVGRIFKSPPERGVESRDNAGDKWNDNGHGLIA